MGEKIGESSRLHIGGSPSRHSKRLGFEGNMQVEAVEWADFRILRGLRGKWSD